MDFGDLGDLAKNLALLIPIIFLILANFLFKRRKGERTQLEVVASLLSEINYNQKLMEAFLLQWQTKKFKTASWKRNKDKMDYIDQGLRTTLADAYEIAEGFNHEIDAAKKYKSTSYLASVQVDRLRAPLAQSKQGLEEWLQLNKDKEKIFKRRRDLAP